DAPGTDGESEGPARNADGRGLPPQGARSSEAPLRGPGSPPRSSHRRGSEEAHPRAGAAPPRVRQDRASRHRAASKELLREGEGVLRVTRDKKPTRGPDPVPPDPGAEKVATPPPASSEIELLRKAAAERDEIKDLLLRKA